MADILEEVVVAEHDVLMSFPSWDSLAVLSVIAMANSDFASTLSAQDVTSAETVRELFNIMMAKKSSA